MKEGGKGTKEKEEKENARKNVKQEEGVAGSPGQIMLQTTKRNG